MARERTQAEAERMRLAFSVQPGSDLEEVCDRVARVIWQVVTGQPGFASLYPGYFVSMRSIVRDFLAHKGARVVGTRAGGALLTLEAPGDAFGTFGSELGMEIACGLAELF